MNITQIREKYPQYNDISDGALAYGFWNKDYKDIPMGQFADQVGLSSEGFNQMVQLAEESGYTPTSSSTTEDGVGSDYISNFSHEDQSYWKPTTEVPEADLAAQGATMGWSDEIIGHLAAVKGSLGSSDMTYDELYNRMKDYQENRIKDYRDKNPGKALTYEMGGSLLGPLTIFKSPKFLADLNQGMRAFIASGAWGATYGAGTSKEGERTQGAAEVGIPSAFLGFGLHKGVGFVSNTYNKIFDRTIKSPSIENLKVLKNEAYSKAKELGVRFNAKTLDEYRRIGMYGEQKIKGAIDEGYDPQLNTHTTSALKLFDKKLKEWQKKGATLEQLDSLNKHMWNKLAESGESEVRIYSLIQSIDKMIQTHPNTSAAMSAAKQANSVFNKAKMLDWELQKALNNKEVTGSLGQKYKAAVRTILNSKKLNKFLDENDIAAMQAFLKGNITDKTLKNTGKLAPNFGLMGVIQGVVSYNEPLFLIASATASISKHYFNKRTTKAAETLMNQIKQFKPPTPSKIPFVAPTSTLGYEQVIKPALQ